MNALRTRRIIAGFVMIFASVGFLSAQSGCGFSFSSRFRGATVFDNVQLIKTVASFNDGVDEHTVVAGTFSSVGTIVTGRFAEFVGETLRPLDGIPDTTTLVGAMTTADTGTGQVLHIAARRTLSTGTTEFGVYRRNAGTWQLVGSPLAGLPTVLSVQDDGTGPALFVAGPIDGTTANAVNGLAKWSGTSWSMIIGSSVPGFNVAPITSIAVAAGSPTPTYYVSHQNTGGVVQFVGGVLSSINSGFPANFGAPFTYFASLAYYDDGNGPALYVAGRIGFSENIYRYSGTTWAVVGGGLNGSVQKMLVYDDGSGPSLYLGGDFTAVGTPVGGVSQQLPRVARWNGTSWSPVGAGFTGSVRGLAVCGSGANRRLVADGTLGNSGVAAVQGLAKWDGVSWSGFGNQGVGFPPYGTVAASCVHDDGQGPALYAAGNFLQAGDKSARGVARWNGTSWSSVGSGPTGIASTNIAALASFDDGTGPALYAGGTSINLPGFPTSSVIRWNGTNWTPVGGPNPLGIFVRVYSLCVFDDGNGPALYAAGDFDTLGGVPAYNIAKWNGTAWTPLSATLGTGLPGIAESVYAMTSYDDGTGPKLYVGGQFGFTSNGSLIRSLAYFDGSTWNRVGTGLDGSASIVGALTVYDDGQSSRLVVGGIFSSVGGVPAENLAVYDGAGLTPLGQGVSSSTPAEHVSALTTFDDGSGPALVIGGSFTSSGPVPLSHIARYRNGVYSSFSSGLEGSTFVFTPAGYPACLSLTSFDLGQGPSLFAGGAFSFAGGVESINAAIWRPEVSTTPCAALGGDSQGKVGSAIGGPFDVLFVNGSSGISRRVDLEAGEPFTISVTAPTSFGAPSSFVVFGMIGIPTPSDPTVLPVGLGTASFPFCPLAPTDGRLFTLTDNIGIPGCAGGIASVPTPWAFVQAPGIELSLEFALQGLLIDPTAPFGVSLTNAVLVVID